MVQNYLSGFLVLIASIIIFYQSIILYKKKRWYIFFTIPLGVCMAALGCAGFYKKDLDGINILLFGLTMFYTLNVSRTTLNTKWRSTCRLASMSTILFIARWKRRKS